MEIFLCAQLNPEARNGTENIIDCTFARVHWAGAPQSGFRNTEGNFFTLRSDSRYDH